MTPRLQQLTMLALHPLLAERPYLLIVDEAEDGAAIVCNLQLRDQGTRDRLSAVLCSMLHELEAQSLSCTEIPTDHPGNPDNN